MKNYRGIIERPHFIVQKQTELQNELYDEWKTEHQLYYCSPDWMIRSGQIPWNAIAICEMSKISWQTEKLRMNEDLVNHLKDQPFHLVHSGGISPKLRERERVKARIHQFGKKVLSGIFLGYALIAGRIWKGDILIADIEELENWDASENYPRRLNAKEVLITQKSGRICFSCSRSFSNTIIERLHLWTTRFHCFNWL